MNTAFTINSLKNPPSGCLIFLHGTGDTGRGLGESIKALKGKSAHFPHIKIVFPTAPLIPFSAYGGMPTNTWYDISGFTDDALEKKDQIELSAGQIKKVIQNEVDSGIPINRIAVAGFSRGGAMSFYIGYGHLRVTELAGVGVLSSWLPKSSPLYEQLAKFGSGKRFPPLFQSHGIEDSLISPKLGQKTCSFFKSTGIETVFKSYPYVGHELSSEVLDDLYEFVQTVIPEK